MPRSKVHCTPIPVSNLDFKTMKDDITLEQDVHLIMIKFDEHATNTASYL